MVYCEIVSKEWCSALVLQWSNY